MIKCLIVDDEPFAIELIEKHISAFEDMQVVATCKDVVEAVNVLQAHQVDLMFLDVRMPEITGIEFLENTQDPPQVILTTAYREYAVQAYEFGVLDYLVKPISFMRFAKAVERYRQLNQSPKADIMGVPVVVKSGADYHKILPKNIKYIKSAREYVSIQCSKAQYLVRSSMTEILEELPQGFFVQVHKSYIVPVGDITSITSSDVILADDSKIPLGRSYADAVKKNFSA